MEYLLLAERLRVEERQLIAAFSAVGSPARLVTPAEIGSIAFGGLSGRSGSGFRSDESKIVSRLHPTREASALLWALESVGWTVLPGAAQMDVFARRDRLYRELSRAGVPVVETVLGWGAGAILSAVDEVGWPVELLPLDGGESGIIVEDREGAEAVVEHRAVLGREHVLLVRRGASPSESRRLLIAGGEVFATLPSGEADWTVDPVTPADLEIAGQVSAAIGAPLIDMTYLPDADNAVTQVMPLLSFRAVQSGEFDVAAAIARYVGGTEAVHG
ncbi:lysine biosynthesis protein LysX [soil metagenome]